MSLREHLESSGNWLFRWRSYLPFLLFLLLIPASLAIHRPFGSDHIQNAWEIGCFIISLTGLLLRGLVSGQVPPKTSGRNTRSQVAATLNTTGVYSIVRHPLYLGNFLMWLGIALFCFVPWVAVIFSLCFWIYYERIMYAEEEFLRRKFGETFTTWSAQTPAFIPRFSLWRPATRPLSLKTSLRKEHTGLFGIGVAFAGMDQFEHFITAHRFSLEMHWIVICGLSSLTYLALRMLKKRTNLLNVPQG